MKEHRVLIALPTEKAWLDEIAALGPGVRVDVAAREYEALMPKGGVGLRPSEEKGESAERELHDRMAGVLRDAEVLYTGLVLPDLLDRAPGLKWIHLSSHGADHVPESVLKSNVVITTGQGGFTEAVAEHVMMLALMLAKQAPRFIRRQIAHRWDRSYSVTGLWRCTMGLVGLGSIGLRVAHLAKAFGMRVIGTRRTPIAGALPDVDEAVSRDRLAYLLGESDFVALVLPSTPETKNLIDEKALRAMKHASCLINVSRGDIVDEPVLIRALREGWIAGAALDHFQTAPLPADSPLWDLENVVVTPRSAGASSHTREDTLRVFKENLERYVAGRPLLNVFDRERGY